MREFLLKMTGKGSKEEIVAALKALTISVEAASAEELDTWRSDTPIIFCTVDSVPIED